MTISLTILAVILLLIAWKGGVKLGMIALIVVAAVLLPPQVSSTIHDTVSHVVHSISQAVS